MNAGTMLEHARMMAEIEVIMSRHGMTEPQKDKIIDAGIAWKDRGSDLVEEMLSQGMTPEEMQVICRTFQNMSVQMILERSPLLKWKEERKNVGKPTGEQ